MVSLPAFYLDSPVDLLEEDDPRQRVWQGDPPEGQVLVRSSEHLRGEPERAAEHEGDVTIAGDA